MKFLQQFKCYKISAYILKEEVISYLIPSIIFQGIYIKGWQGELEIWTQVFVNVDITAWCNRHS